MRRSLLTTISLLILVSVHTASAGPDVGYSKRWVCGLPVHVITANLNSPNVKITAAVARHGVGSSEGFGSMLSRLRPTAAITGTYFCVNSLLPVGHIVIDGKLVASGSVGTGICFTPDNRVEFRNIRVLDRDARSAYTTAVCAGPRLVSGGKVGVYPFSEGFRDPALFSRNTRSAIGVTAGNKVLLVAVTRPVYLRTLARIMKELGAVDAINLDGGSSTAMYHAGRVICHPARRLTNLILVYENAAKPAGIGGQPALPRTTTSAPASRPVPSMGLTLELAPESPVESYVPEVLQRTDVGNIDADSHVTPETGGMDVTYPRTDLQERKREGRVLRLR